MQKLHLVGSTTDQEGLILSARRGARSGGYTLVLDDALAQAVEELRARQEEEEAAGSALRGRSDRSESRLPISEIQARLRRGRSLKDVAKEAGVEPEWVERFAAPVFAEQAEIISRVQAAHLRRARLGPSGVRIGDAVRRNLVERDVVLSPDELREAWTTHQRPDGRWVVRFAFTYRGRARTLRYELKPNGDITAADAFTSQLSYIAPTQRRAAPRRKPAAPVVDAAAKRAIVSVGYRAEPPPKAVSRPAKEREKAALAMQKAAGRRAIEGERAANRLARERAQAIARRERQARMEAQQRAKEAAARAREAAAQARLEAAEAAEREKTAAAAAAARQAERDAARRAARRKVASAAKVVAAKKGATPARPAPTRPAAPAVRPAAAKKATATKGIPSSRPTPPRTPPRTSPATGSSARAAAPRPSSTTPRRPAPARPAPRPAASGRNPGQRLASTRPESEALPPRPDRASTAPPVTPPAPRRPPAPRPADRPSPSERVVAVPPPRSAARGAAAPTARSAPSVDVPAADSARALFRAGLADPADGPPTAPVPAVRASPASEGPDRRPPASSNGDTAAAPVVRQRPPGLRRTRPLRAN